MKREEKEEEEDTRRSNTYIILEYMFEFGLKGYSFSQDQGHELGPLLFLVLPHLTEYAKELSADELKFFESDCMSVRACTARSALQFLLDENSPYREFPAWHSQMAPLDAILRAVDVSEIERKKALLLQPFGFLGNFITWSFIHVDWKMLDDRFVNMKLPNYDAKKYTHVAPAIPSFYPTSHFWWGKIKLEELQKEMENVAL